MAQTTKVRPSLRRDHDNTVISRQNRRLENSLARALNQITNIIRRENPQNQIDIILARQKHFDRVYATIRKYSQESYLLGSKYVSNIGNFQPYLSTSDMDIIKSLSNDFTARFFGRISKAFEINNRTISTTTTTIIDNNNNNVVAVVDPLSKYSNNFIVNSLAVAITSKALNLATIRKAQIMLPQAISQVIQQKIQQQEQAVIIIKQGAIFDTLNRIFNPIQVYLVWTTARDDRVCPLCASLEGSQYYIDDPDIPNPPDDTHWNCRCRLLFKQETDLALFLALGAGPTAQRTIQEELLFERQQQELEDLL